jgi:hypothetical protein
MPALRAKSTFKKSHKARSPLAALMPALRAKSTFKKSRAKNTYSVYLFRLLIPFTIISKKIIYLYF